MVIQCKNSISLYILPDQRRENLLVIYIAKLVMNFRNRKIIKNLLEITIFILEQYILHSNILMGNMRLVRFCNFVNVWPYM